MVPATFFVICLTFSIIHNVNSEKNCDTLGILLYEDLGCKAVKPNGEDCPTKYECDDFSQKNDSCLFRGRSYGLNQEIEKALTYPFCDVGCFCGNSLGSAEFTCAVLDCPEWLGVPVGPGCYRKFSVDDCCSVGMNCPSEGKALETCNVDGKTYNEGEKFFPKNTCLKCVCDKNFEKPEAPFCKRFMCNAQIKNPRDINNKCAPCYFKTKGETLCCPDTWVCPSSSDNIIKVNTEKDSDLTCSFGSKTLKLGEGFQRKVNHYGTDRNVQCECAIPPLLTCQEV